MQPYFASFAALRETVLERQNLFLRKGAKLAKKENYISQKALQSTDNSFNSILDKIYIKINKKSKFYTR